AIMENREFTVISPIDGKQMKVTPERELSNQEMAVMSHYAREKVSLHKGKGKFEESSYGGTGILRHAGKDSLTDFDALKTSKDPEKNAVRQEAVEKALQGYLNRETGRMEKQATKAFDSEAQRLGGEKPRVEQDRR